jgi:hypothetical protein
MLNAFEKISILQLFDRDIVKLTEYLSNKDSEKVFNARNLIEDIILEKLSEKKETYTTRGELRKCWEPIQKYFDSHQCGEDIDDCKKDTCYKRNPNCFKTKALGQIKSMSVFFEERLGIFEEKK